MNRNVSLVARILGVDAQQVKRWAALFADYLSPASNPPKGTARALSDLDLLVLAYISEYWEAEPDLEAIKIGLNEGDHLNERSYELLYSNSPILQEPPEELDESWRHGVLWTGGHGQERFELARNYRYVAEIMLAEALKREEPRDWICPVLFAYRHTLELYLKTLGSIDEHTHSLAACMKLVEKRHHAKCDPRVRGWIEELDKIDPHPGTAFRYEDDQRPRDYAEYWVDLRQFKFAMGQILQMIDMAVLQTWGNPPHGGAS
jgi:hypothetical protein